MQLDVESLRTFTTVLDLGGMTRAAEALDISQSAVSWKIKRLEEKVGRDLLIRDGRTLRPSRDGRELLDYARTIVATHDEAVSRLESSELTGTVKLGTTEEISAARMCDVLARFNRIHPGAMIEFVVDGSSRLDAMLQRTDTRFLIITHHGLTMARMNRLFGVTMMERGVSQLVSVDLETAESLREAS